jgi:hypothetical protein
MSLTARHVHAESPNMEIFLGFLAILLVPTGWILGVVGFFRARRALRELAALRREIASGSVAAVAPAPVAQVPVAPPFGQPWPEAAAVAVADAAPQPMPAPAPEAIPQPMAEPVAAA